MNEKQRAIVKKDLKGLVFDKFQFPVLFIVPLAFVVLIPTMFILLINLGYDSMNMQAEVQKLMDMLPVTGQSDNMPLFTTEAILNYIMPVFFLIIPTMASMIMAASSFVGEKENRTLETLFYSPLSLRQIFQAKIMASFLLSMIVSIASFLVFLLVVETEFLLVIGSLYIPSFSWLITLLLVSPAVSFISITLIVHGSAKAKTMQESQQRAMFIVFPLIFLIVGQFTGIILIGPLLLLSLGVIFALLGVFLMKGIIKKLSYEGLLS